jgi:translation initiation factor IF-2
MQRCLIILAVLAAGAAAAYAQPEGQRPDDGRVAPRAPRAEWRPPRAENRDDAGGPPPQAGAPQDDQPPPPPCRRELRRGPGRDGGDQGFGEPGPRQSDQRGPRGLRGGPPPRGPGFDQGGSFGPGGPRRGGQGMNGPGFGAQGAPFGPGGGFGGPRGGPGFGGPGFQDRFGGPDRGGRGSGGPGFEGPGFGGPDQQGPFGGPRAGRMRPPFPPPPMMQGPRNGMGPGGDSDEAPRFDGQGGPQRRGAHRRPEPPFRDAPDDQNDEMPPPRN